MQTSLSQRVALIVLVLFMGGFGLIVYMATSRLEDNLTAMLADQQAASVHFVGNVIEQKVTLREESLQDVANNLPADHMHDQAALTDYLNHRIAIYRLFSNGVVVIDRQGAGVADHPTLPGRATSDFHNQDFFKQVIATGHAALGRPRVGQFTHNSDVAVAVPIRDRNGTTVGVFAGFIGLTDQNVFARAHARLGKTGEFMLISVDDRMVITDTNNLHALKQLDFEQGEDWHLKHLLAAPDGSSVENNFYGTRALVSIEHILGGKWLVIGALPTEEAFAPVVRAKRQFYMAACMVALIVGALLWYVMRRQLLPLTEATRVLRKMANEGAPLPEVAVASMDEIGQLLTTFNRLHREMSLAQHELWVSKENYKNLFEHMTSGFALHEMIFDDAGKPVDYRYVKINPAYERMTGLQRDQVVGRTAREVLPDVENSWIGEYGAVVTTGQSWSHKHFSESLMRWYSTVAYRPAPGQFAIIVEDVTDLKKAETELKRLAHHDILTGLPNRVLFIDRLQLALAQADRRGQRLAVGYIDLDRFKAVNDTYGHGVGDQLLIAVASRLKEAMRAVDSISRFGGDEFAVLLCDTGDEDALKVLLARVLEIVDQPYELGCVRLEMSISIGVTVYPDDNGDPETLLRHADKALYEAKAAGRNVYQIYG